MGSDQPRISNAEVSDIPRAEQGDVTSKNPQHGLIPLLVNSQALRDIATFSDLFPWRPVGRSMGDPPGRQTWRAVQT